MEFDILQIQQTRHQTAKGPNHFNINLHIAALQGEVLYQPNTKLTKDIASPRMSPQVL